jgi:hypothetical protein
MTTTTTDLDRTVCLDLAHSEAVRYRDALDELVEAMTGRRMTGPELLAAAFDVGPEVGAQLLHGAPLLVDATDRDSVALRQAMEFLVGALKSRAARAGELVVKIEALR